MIPEYIKLLQYYAIMCEELFHTLQVLKSIAGMCEELFHI